jgi:hypothetical protein
MRNKNGCHFWVHKTVNSPYNKSIKDECHEVEVLLHLLNVFCRHLFTFDELKALQVTLELIIQLFCISCSYLFGIWKKKHKIKKITFLFRCINLIILTPYTIQGSILHGIQTKFNYTNNNIRFHS